MIPILFFANSFYTTYSAMKQTRFLIVLLVLALCATPPVYSASLGASRQARGADRMLLLVRADFEDDGYALERRRGGSSGGGGRGGGGVSSSGSRGSSSSSSSSSSRGSSSSSSSSSSSRGSSSSSSSSRTPSTFFSTTSSPRLANGRYAGGAATPFLAGAALGTGIAVLYLTSSALWGPWGAYEYRYTATAANGSTYDVRCLCARYNPCSCAQPENGTATDAYVAALPPGAANVSLEADGVRTVVVNGTLENATEASGSAAASAAAPGVLSPGVLVVVAVAAGTLFL